MRSSTRFLVRATSAVLTATALAACEIKTTGLDGLCILGPCGSVPYRPVDISYVIGFPDSLMSKDPYDQIGVMSVGDTVVLHYIHPGPVPAGLYAYKWACGSTAIVHDSLRWAVSDSVAGSIVRPTAGTAVVRARAPGRFDVLTTTLQTPIVPQQLWIAGIVACPSGRGINTIQVVAKSDSLSRIRSPSGHSIE